MNARQMNDVCNHYCDMFGDSISAEAEDILREISDVNDLETYRDTLSAGEFDCAEAILLNL